MKIVDKHYKYKEELNNMIQLVTASWVGPIGYI